MPVQPNCPFYGFSMYRPGHPSALPFILIPSRGNQRALVVDSHAPCMMQPHDPIEWAICPRVGNVRLGEAGMEDPDEFIARRRRELGRS